MSIQPPGAYGALGRRVNHDPRSRAFRAPQAGTYRPVMHKITGEVLDQGQLGSCVANAGTHALNSRALKRWWEWPKREPFAVKYYGLATGLDSYPGTYPPDDTGTDANSLGKALRADGRITSWTHCFGLDHLLGALQLAPVLVGFEWDEGCDRPDATGLIRPGGNPRGGHETLVIGDDANGILTVRNSWGPDWGAGGHYRIGYDDLAAKLASEGDATVLHRGA